MEQREHDLQVHERLTKVFRDVFNDPSLEVKKEYIAKDIPGWDSLAHINLIVSIEEEFDIRFTTEEIASLTRVGDVEELILKRAKL